MKIILNQTNFNTTNYYNTNYKTQIRSFNNVVSSTQENNTQSSAIISLANFPNISFKGNPSFDFMIEHGPDLCAYTRTLLLRPSKYEELLQKLTKRPNAQSAINLLQSQQIYMHNIESIIFDIFMEAPHKNKRTFDDILKEELPQALTRLKDTQIKALTKTNSLVNKMGEDVRLKVIDIRDEALDKISNDTFSRKSPLEKISRIQTDGKDEEFLNTLYRIWYNSLLSSSTSLDAFIVKNAKLDHFTIARHLLSPSVKTIEHITAQARNGSDNLYNLLPVCAEINNKKGSMTLNQFISLEENINIPKNLQLYMDDIIKLVNNPRTPFSDKPSYPTTVAKTILEDSNGKIVLDTSKLQIPQKLIYENEMFKKKLEQKYNVKK